MPPKLRADGFIRVTGLKELAKALREIDKDLPKEMSAGSQQVAQHIVDRATTAAASVGPMQRKAARSLAAARQQKMAAIKYGGARYPFAMGAEFGGGKYGAGNPKPGSGGRGFTTQFRPWRGNSSDAGYFLYPTIRRESDRIVELYGQVLDDLINKHLT